MLRFVSFDVVFRLVLFLLIRFHICFRSRSRLGIWPLTYNVVNNASARTRDATAFYLSALKHGIIMCIRSPVEIEHNSSI